MSARSAIRAMLSEMGFNHITEATDGKHALETLSSDTIKTDFVLSDWNMPNKDGLELLSEVRIKHPNLPFVMVTARADETSVKDAVKAGVSGYVRKPFSMKDLESKNHECAFGGQSSSKTLMAPSHAVV